MFITLCKVESYNISIQMRTIRQYFPVMLFMSLYKVVVMFESLNQTIVVQANEKLLLVVQSNPVNTDTKGAIHRTCLY